MPLRRGGRTGQSLSRTHKQGVCTGQDLTQPLLPWQWRCHCHFPMPWHSQRLATPHHLLLRPFAPFGTPNQHKSHRRSNAPPFRDTSQCIPVQPRVGSISPMDCWDGSIATRAVRAQFPPQHVYTHVPTRIYSDSKTLAKWAPCTMERTYRDGPMCSRAQCDIPPWPPSRIQMRHSTELESVLHHRGRRGPYTDFPIRHCSPHPKRYCQD
mmetsp:Transcript_36132/g.61595  ORF Transcript_36132/g.61595 Transcript_36132/m.61595 type:complete len:210 (-) Transcript_36132:837-1466(-)